MSKSLVSINDLSSAQLRKVLDLAHAIKKNPEDYRCELNDSFWGLIFEKPSTRTMVSFQSGIYSLGGGATKDISLGAREQLKDVARALNRYLSGAVLRTFSHSTITEFKKYFKKPVINGLSDLEHPCQAVGDYLTIEEHYKGKKKPVLAFVGDGNNVLNSLLLLSAKLGCDIRYATPKGLEPHTRILKSAKKTAEKTGAVIKGFYQPEKAVKNADFIYTDVWVSMGEEDHRDEKLKAFKGMQVNKGLLAQAKKNVKVMHCLPAHRGEEITDEVMEGKHSIVFDQAENRLHAQKAVLLYLMDGVKK